MGIQVNETQKEYKLYTGLMDFDIVGINPTQEELEEILGRDLNKAPEYVGEKEVEDEDGNKVKIPQRIIRVWLKNEEYDVVTAHSIYVADREVPAARSGKRLFMSNTGNSCYVDTDANGGADVSNLKNASKWFHGPYRIAMDGERELYQFIVATLNVNTASDKNVIVLNTDWEDIVAGDLEEIKDTLDNGRVRFLLGARARENKDNDGNTRVNWNQEVYSRCPMAYGAENTRQLSRELENQAKGGYPWKANYQDQTAILEFLPSEHKAPESEETPATKQEVAAAVDDL